MITAKIIKDSISHANIRVTTFELEYPRYIHSELLTHRVFSRNCASSRAIPIEKQIELCLSNPVKPEFTMHAKGMSGEPADRETRKEAQKIWDLACSQMIAFAEELYNLGIHKQNVNRLLEPFQHMKTILTGTDFDNFFNLRLDGVAQPEIYLLASKMKDAMDNSIPEILDADMWHLPYIEKDDFNGETLETIKKISVACCAQVSYRKLDTSKETALRIYDKLINSGKLHASPFEHICRPNYAGETQKGNLRGWHQFRADVEETINNEK